MATPVTEKELVENIEIWREEGYSKSKVSKRLGIERNAVRYRISKAKELGLVTDHDLEEEAKLIKKHKHDRVKASKPKPNKVRVASKSIRAVKVTDLIDQERLDHAKIVRTALSKLKIDECILDDVFRRDLSISNERWKEVRDLDEFLNCQVLLPNKKRVWCHLGAREDLLSLDGVREI